MTKQELLDLGLTEEQAGKVLQLAHSYNDTRTHPPVYDDDKIIAKWCSRHKRYEPIGVFPKNARAKDGYYSHCRYAEKHIKSIARHIDKLKASAFDGEVDMKALKKEINELESQKHVFTDEGFTKSQLDQIIELNMNY